MPMRFHSTEKFSEEIPIPAVFCEGRAVTLRQRETLSSAILRTTQPMPFFPSLFCNAMRDTVLHNRTGVAVFIGF